MSRARLVVVEGNISAGKSTLARDIAEQLNYRLFLEPVIGNPYLSRFYADPRKYALRMQIWLLRQRFATYVKAWRHIGGTGQGAILDRSVFSDWVFAEKNRLDGNISRSGFIYYSELRLKMLAGLPRPDAVLYLDVSPAECFRRVHHLRQRAAEAGIPLDYLQGLAGCYHQLLDDLETKAAVGRAVQRALPSQPPPIDLNLLANVARLRELSKPSRKFEDDWTDDEADSSLSLEDATDFGLQTTSVEAVAVVAAKRCALAALDNKEPLDRKRGISALPHAGAPWES